MLQNSEYTVYCLDNQVSSQAVRRLKLRNKLGPSLSNHDKPQIQGLDLFLSGSKVGCGESGKTSNHVYQSLQCKRHHRNFAYLFKKITVHEKVSQRLLHFLANFVEIAKDHNSRSNCNSSCTLCQYSGILYLEPRRLLSEPQF